MQDWLKEYMTLFFRNREESYRFKLQHIPNKLYKYQPINDRNRDSRLKSIKENKLWFTKAPFLNDPFDCQPTYYNEKELREFIEREKLAEKVGKTTDDLIAAINQSLVYFRNNIKVVCFTESPFNMPMWGNYADNHKGICVEYDFTQLDARKDFIKMLHPVGYDSKRYDITNILKSIASGVYKSNPYVLFFLMMMKHESWEYEKEWRVLDFDFEESPGNGSLIDCPVKPSAIYFGMNCSEHDIKAITSIVDSDTKLNKLVLKNHEFFHLDLVN